MEILRSAECIIVGSVNVGLHFVICKRVKILSRH